MTDPLRLVTPFPIAPGRTGRLVSLPELERRGFGPVSRLPVRLRIVLESLPATWTASGSREEDVRALAAWQPRARADRARSRSWSPASCSRTSPACRCWWTSPRCAPRWRARARTPSSVEPLVPVDLVIDHSVQVDCARRVADALQLNMGSSSTRNRARYEFLKWGTAGVHGARDRAARHGHRATRSTSSTSRHGVLERTASPTPTRSSAPTRTRTMINGLGIVAWGVGGIEAEAAMLGQPVYFLTPDVVGVHLTGALRRRRHRHRRGAHHHRDAAQGQGGRQVRRVLRRGRGGAAGAGARARSRTWRRSTARRWATSRSTSSRSATCSRPAGAEAWSTRCARTSRRRGCSASRGRARCDYTEVLELDLSDRQAERGRAQAAAGPDRAAGRSRGPSASSSRSDAERLRQWTAAIASAPPASAAGEDPTCTGGGAQDPRVACRTGWRKNTSRTTESEMMQQPAHARRRSRRRPSPPDPRRGRWTSGTATCSSRRSPPAPTPRTRRSCWRRDCWRRRRSERGLTVRPEVKTSLAPGSRVVSRYLEKTGLQPYLDKLGFPDRRLRLHHLHRELRAARPARRGAGHEERRRGRGVLSGNRNFEARVHQSIKANFLMSPPLVVAFALAGPGGHRHRQGADRDRPRRPARLPARHLADAGARSTSAGAAAGDPRRTGRTTASCRPPEPAPREAWNEMPRRGGVAYEWDRELDLHPGAALLRDVPAHAQRARRDPRRAPAGHLRRLGHHRPHQPGRLHQGDLARPAVPPVAGREDGRLQQLRRAARQPRGHGARHLRQRPHQEPDGAGRRGRRDVAPADGERMSIYDAALAYAQERACR